ncbi:SsgA family sporulation/cell division regulator [Streptacidiphilus fuscans]|uniref:SsgA family sporulation/cell division regulator n=1 Tax=Streptacidiphilus fuscans TaxID=2789292 RepID=A0A931B1H1_9ACTN|nr:SsgA family sporulation/cell division regulator [Streptacidiphilus fuscans]MBF9067186.1 SsgA family sporulation/cell division regulator [Streptacidiphilus fuscans]
MNSEFIEVRRDLTGVIVSGHCMPARIELRYDAADAYAVGIRLMTKRQHPCLEAGSWLLARDLLREGLTHAVGDGDIRVRPITEDWLLLELGVAAGGPAEPVMLIMAFPDVRGFLDATSDLVPYGTEDSTIDWQALLDS